MAPTWAHHALSVDGERGRAGERKGTVSRGDRDREGEWEEQGEGEGEEQGEGELLPPKLCVGMHTHRVHAVPREPIHTTLMGDGFR